jgi:hypothetical protein
MPPADANRTAPGSTRDSGSDFRAIETGHLPPAMAAFILTARHTADAWDNCAATASEARDTRRAAIAQAMADLSRAMAI